MLTHSYTGWTDSSNIMSCPAITYDLDIIGFTGADDVAHIDTADTNFFPTALSDWIKWMPDAIDPLGNEIHFNPDANTS